MSAVPVSAAFAGVSGTVHAAATAVQQCNAFGFTGLTGSSGDVAIGRGHFFMEVSQGLAAGQATLQFRNVGAAPSSIAGIFFEDRGKGGSADTQVPARFATFAATPTGVTVIPAPAALLLGSLGAGLVGMLQRRRML